MNKKIFYLFLLLVLVGTIFGGSAYLQTVFSQLTDSIDAYVSRHFFLGAIIFTGLAAFSVLLGPFTSAPLIPFAVVIWHIPLTLAMLMAGWLLGNTGAFWIGRYLGHPLVAKIVGHKKLDDWLAALQPRLSFPLLLLFRLATPSETGYVFGLLKYDFRKYLLLSFLAELPFAFIIVFASDALTNTGWASFLLLLLAWIVIISLALYEFRKKFQNGKP
ncbi:MAG: hypothetical protein UY73_C0037G0003 [Parcubacteria group bacterium GW2011_GWA2_52_8]|nr:MAG: hypothetical protein UY73_C0037G0003 [Parcubacteria group bacterium GW2011_GWA2_52_8]